MTSPARGNLAKPHPLAVPLSKDYHGQPTKTGLSFCRGFIDIALFLTIIIGKILTPNTD